MADGGGFYGPGFNNPRIPTIQTKWGDFNVKNNTAQSREPIRSVLFSKTSQYGYDNGRTLFDNTGKMDSNDEYKLNRNMNSNCSMSQGYSSHMSAVYTPNSSHQQGVHEHRSLPCYNGPSPMSSSQGIPSSQPMPPFGRMTFSRAGNPMQPNSFNELPPPFIQNQMFTDNRQPINTLPYPQPMYNMHNNICMPPPAPPPPPSPSLPYHNQMGHQPGLMQLQSEGMPVLPTNQTQVDTDQELVSKSVDQEWVNRFVEERKYTFKEKQKKPSLKVGESRHILQRWLQLLDTLALQRDKLINLIKCGESEWQRELQNTRLLKEKLQDTEREFSTQVDTDSLNTELRKKKKKRKWQTKRKQALAQDKLDTDKKKFELHIKIDQWREKEIAKDQAKFKAASMKKEAGGVLGDIKRKLTDSSKSLNVLHAITKLRNFRKQEAELKGVYPKPTAEQNKQFNNQLMLLEKIMSKHHELYESEEKTLEVMLAEEEEEKERERREKNQRKQLAQAAASESSDPMRDFYRYYTQADNGLDSLVHIRHGWDMYIVPASIPGASRIPQSKVTAVEPSKESWAKLLKDKG